MERLRVDEVLHLLPELDELRPLVEAVFSTSVPDEGRRWTASGELETVGQHVVSARRLRRDLPSQLDRMRTRLERVYGGLAAVVAALERGDRVGAARELVRIAEEEERDGSPDRAEAYARAAYDVSRTERSYGVRVHALRTAARAARAQGKLDASTRDYEAAYRTAVDAREASHATVAAIGRGNVAVDRGEWDEARSWYLRALETMGEHGPPSPERWHVCVDLSIATRRLGDLAASRSWLERAEREASALGTDQAEAILSNAWGRWHLADGRADLAEDAFARALATADAPAARVTIGVNLAEALLGLDRDLDAAEAARRAEATALQHRVFTKLPEVYRVLGRIASARGQDDAFVFFERALEIVTERRLPDYERAETLEAYAGMGTLDAAEAAERLRAAGALYESSNNESAVGRIREALRRLDRGTDVKEGDRR